METSVRGVFAVSIGTPAVAFIAPRDRSSEVLRSRNFCTHVQEAFASLFMDPSYVQLVFHVFRKAFSSSPHPPPPPSTRPSVQGIFF